MANILVVEDDENLNRIICSYLVQNNYRVRGCHDPVEAYKLLESEIFDLIISDIMMPKVNGFAFAEEIRRDYPMMPVLFITALDDLASKKKGFAAGVDDYMVKPVEMDEIVLRVGALLRRAKRLDDKKLQVGDVTLVPEEMAAYIGGEEVPILPKEFNILYKLLSHPKRYSPAANLSTNIGDFRTRRGYAPWTCMLPNCARRLQTAKGLRSSPYADSVTRR